MVTGIETMCDIISEAGASDDAIVWEQDDLWQEAIELISSKKASDFTMIDHSLVRGTFLDMLNTMGIKDTGFTSYQEMKAVFLDR